MTIEAVEGDITEQRVDAIVNAANSSLIRGGGVDGAIHRAAGPTLLEECRALRADRYRDGLPVGQAVVTGAGHLAARWVIHTVGPSRHARQTDPELLASCFRKSLAEAGRARSMPASMSHSRISTGYPCRASSYTSATPSKEPTPPAWHHQGSATIGAAELADGQAGQRGGAGAHHAGPVCRCRESGDRDHRGSRGRGSPLACLACAASRASRWSKHYCGPRQPPPSARPVRGSSIMVAPPSSPDATLLTYRPCHGACVLSPSDRGGLLGGQPFG